MGICYILYFCTDYSYIFPNKKMKGVERHYLCRFEIHPPHPP